MAWYAVVRRTDTDSIARQPIDSTRVFLRQVVAFLVFTIVIFVPMCAAHADEGSGAYLGPEDRGPVPTLCNRCNSQ